VTAKNCIKSQSCPYSKTSHDCVRFHVWSFKTARSGFPSIVVYIVNDIAYQQHPDPIS